MMPLDSQQSVCPANLSLLRSTRQAHVVSAGPAHPSRKDRPSDKLDPAIAEAVDEPGQDNLGNCCIPSSIFAELNAKDHLGSRRADALPGWGCFRPVVLPSKVPSTRTHFHEDPKKLKDGDDCSGGRTYRFGFPARWTDFLSHPVKA